MTERQGTAMYYHLSPLYEEVKEHTNHKFSESLSSGDDNGEDKYKVLQ